MKNYVASGENLQLTAPAEISSGAGVLIGKIFGVAQGNAGLGDPFILARRGVFTLPKVSSQAWAEGAAVYWDASESEATTTSTDNVLIGAATAAVANPSATGTVLLDGGIR